MPRHYDCKFLRIDRRDILKNTRPLQRAYHQLRPHLRADALSKIGIGRIIQRNRNDSANRASQKCGYPLRPIWSPQQHRIALDDFSRLELTRKLVRYSRNSRVAPALAPVSARKYVGASLTVSPTPALEIVQRIQ